MCIFVCLFLTKMSNILIKDNMFLRILCSLIVNKHCFYNLETLINFVIKAKIPNHRSTKSIA